MKMLRSKRRILAMALALVLAFGSCLTVSAEIDTPMPQVTYFDTSEMAQWKNLITMPYALLCLSPSGMYTLIQSDFPLVLYYGKQWGADIYNLNVNADGKVCYHASAESFSSMKDKEFSVITNNTNVVNAWNSTMSNVRIYSSHDMYFDGNLVFQGPATPLYRVAETITPEAVMSETLIILPIVIVTIVGYLALRKGLKMLFSRLRKA